ncbi:GntR family transcriptional regulator [Paenibacillus sp. MWE-103]|uniref:GntR family transcriptional regulator n=1 Tax=Paenibacillus artemisiicola TaxID=1172618 RepID=A0ABS3W3Z0_9BACL|nr:GntR family transcriptional regulator [Paenibacillus artemisiicola]MBO7743000.1 GntR family transcriptional regulator [Paenibacillus artemisiicola]
MQKIGKKTLRHEVYEQLLDGILSGRLPVGSQLDEQELSESLGISRTPLREAINRLVQEKLITEIPYKGNFVRRFAPEEVAEIYEVRKTLEVMAIRQAVRRMTDPESEEIAELVRLMDDAQDRGDIPAYSALDGQFHAKIAEFSRNRVLVQLLGSLDLQIRLIRQMANRKPATVNRSQFERLQISEAIAKRSEDLAAMFMETHIDNVMKDAVAMLREDGASETPD